MSLQVWLPLNGNFDNYGLSNVSVTNSGATVNDSGKIGKCYRFETNSKYITLNKKCCDLFNDGDSFSYCFWIKISSYSVSGSGSGSGGCVLYQTESSTVNGTTVKGGGFGVLINQEGNATAYANPFNSAKSVGIGTIPLNVWTHICMTYEKSTRILTTYKNGNYVSKSTAIADWGANGYTFVFGKGSQGGFTNTSDNYQNDIRIYDHCLSPKEVKEISKGLVLHYKFDDAYVEGTTNLFNDVLLQWSGLSCQTSSSKSNDIYTVTIANLTGNYTTGSSRMNIPLSILENGAQYCISFKYKVISGNGTININGCDWCDRAFVSKSESIVGEYHYIKLVCPIRDTYNNTFRFMDFSWTDVNTVYEISEMQLEKKDHVTPYINGTRTPFIVYDTSGYNNHGTITGNLSVSNDSPRYELSTKFNGANYIYRTPLDCSSEVKTISFWANWDSIPSGQSVLFVDNGTKTGFGLMSTGILLTTSGAGSSYTYPKSSLTANTWYNFVIIITGTTTRDLYINGVKQTATSSTSNLSYTVNQLQIGKRSSTSDGFVGKMSDFRMYTTALSEDDIKELYDTAALIDNGHNLHCYEFVEDDVTSPLIEKNGLVKTNEFNEYPDDYIFYDYIESSGTQYIDTEVPANNNMKAEIRGKFLSVNTNSSHLLSARSGSAGYNSLIAWNNNNGGGYFTQFSQSYTRVVMPKDTNIHIIEAIVTPTRTTTKVDSNENFISTENVGYNFNLYINARNVNGTSVLDVSTYRYYYVKIWKEGLLVRDFIPAKRKSDNAIGMYDMVTGRFFGNSGTGAFTTGTPIDVAAMYENKIDLNQLLEI